MSDQPTAPPATIDRKSPRLADLDFLRFLAASSVLLYHFTYTRSLGASAPLAGSAAIATVTKFGYLGVELFFVISGFVILWTATGRTPRQFAISRALRLFPTFWACLILTCLFLWTFAHPDRWPTAPQILANATMLPGYIGFEYIDVVYWTLAVEIKFYFLVFLYLIFGTPSSIERYIAVWIVALLICAIEPDIRYLRSLAMFPYGSLFATGCILFRIYQHGPSPLRICLLISATLLSMHSSVINIGGFVDDPSGLDEMIAAFVTLISISLVLAIALKRVRFPFGRLSVALGSMTYSLYLLHNEIGRIAIDRGSSLIPRYVAVLCAIVLAVTLAWFVTRTVDNGLLGKIRRSQLYRQLAR